MADPILGGEAIDQPSQVRISGELGDESLPRAPAESRPLHKRPGCRFPLLCSLAARQEGRIAVIVNDKGMTAIGVDRFVWLYARSEDVADELIGALQRAWVHVPVCRPVEQLRQVLPGGCPVSC